MKKHSSKTYWSANIHILLQVLSLWFIVAFVIPFFLHDWLNQWSIAGFGLGTWFTFQGVFLLFPCVAWYFYKTMNRLDAQLEEKNSQ